MSEIAYAVMFAALAACNSPTDTGVGAPMAIEVISGGSQSQLAGIALQEPIVVRITDADGRAVQGIRVIPTTSALGAGIDSTLATTSGSDGKVSIRWWLGFGLGRQTLRVELPPLLGVSGIDVTATSVGADVIAVVGSSYTFDQCATYRDGRVGCWQVALPEWAAPAPVMAPGALRFTDLAGGTDGITMFLCAPATTGRVWCTDYDFDSKVYTPWREVAGGYASLTALSGVNSFAAGGARYCGLDPEGVAWCWGANFDGGLGDGTTGSRPDARPVATSARFTSLSLSHYHACALDTTGAAWCWGWNWVGQLGRPTTSGRQLVPMPVLSSLRFSKILATPVPGTCGLTPGRKLYCWGDRFQLGRQVPLASGRSYSDQPLEVMGIEKVAMLARSEWNTFAFGATGSGHWWGGAHDVFPVWTPRPTEYAVPFTELVSRNEGHFGCGRSSATGPGVSCLLYNALGPYEVQPREPFSFRTFTGMGVPAAPLPTPNPTL